MGWFILGSILCIYFYSVSVNWNYIIMREYDSKFRGWIRTIKWALIPLRFISWGRGGLYNQWYFSILTPNIVAFYHHLQYIKKRTGRCKICEQLVPTWQYGSSEGSYGQCCAQCEEKDTIDYAKIKTT